MNRINMVCLGVRDMEKSIRFYKGLGFQTKEESLNPQVIFFNMSGGLKLELCPLELLAEDAGGAKAAASGGGFGGVTLMYSAGSKEEVREITEAAKKAGAKIVKEPQEASWGGYHAWFSDPDGYHWEAAYGPDFSFDENDMLVF
jgi:catechol 2,3-dioxygenase-like lactoylglutathione lyase family enzyme